MPNFLSNAGILLTAQEQGDVVYYNGTAWVVLHHGNAGQVLQSGGNAANPGWTTLLSEQGDILTFSGGSTSAGPNSPGTVASASGSGGTVTWTDYNDVKVSNNTYATAALAANEKTYWLKSQNFGFSIPTAATINGIKVEVEIKASVNNQLIFNEMYIIKTSMDGNDLAASTQISDTESYVTFGGVSELCGLSWTADEINASTFGVGFYVKDNAGASGGTVSVDHVRITVYYTESITMTALHHGTDGQYLKTQGNGANAVWADVVTTPADASITYAKMQHISATDKILGRSTAGAGDVEEISCTAAGRAILDDANAAAQLTTLGAMPIAGGTMTGDITLGENTGIVLDPDGSADEKWTGITVSGTAGATLAVGDLCYLNSGWEWVLTDANAAASAGSVALGLCILAANNDGATRMLLMGTMKSAAFPASITGGAQLYVSTTAGDMTTTQPTGVDDVIRVVGWAILTEPNTILFSPSADYITRTA